MECILMTEVLIRVQIYLKKYLTQSAMSLREKGNLFNPFLCSWNDLFQAVESNSSMAIRRDISHEDGTTHGIC